MVAFNYPCLHQILIANNTQKHPLEKIAKKICVVK